MSNPVVVELPALLGVVVGAISTYATTSLSERSRWRRERTARWDVTRKDAYAEYGASVKKVFHVSIRIATARGLQTSVRPLPPDEDAMIALMDAESARSTAWESVLLMGDPATVAAARTWHEAVWRLGWFAQGRLTGEQAWQAALNASEQARDLFYTAARRDLGVAGEAVPTSPGSPWQREDFPAGPGEDPPRE
jgi:hypothetical protein